MRVIIGEKFPQSLGLPAYLSSPQLITNAEGRGRETGSISEIAGRVVAPGV